jgi:microcystin-dependent protein
MSGLNLTLQAGNAPFDSQLPGNTQALLNFMAQYTLITGGQNFNGLNYGSATPAPANQGIPWFKTDTFGNPIGFFSWNGLTWAALPNQIASGAFSNAPASPSIGSVYYATDIGCTVIYSASGWTTLAGTVGDYKEVNAASTTVALANNPGWAVDTTYYGCVLAAAGPATGITTGRSPGTIVGEEQHTQQITEMPAHTHTLAQGGGGNASATGNAANPSGILGSAQSGATGSTGGGTPFNVMQPTGFVVRLVKMF